VLAVLDDPNFQPVGMVVSDVFPNLNRFGLLETMFKKVAARLDDRDLQRLLDHHLAAGRPQRVLLDLLAESKKRSFRNTWDYLDSIESNGNATAGPLPGMNR
jgi:hypothetical protein